MPLRSLVKIAETSGTSRERIYELIDQGKIKAKKTTLPLGLDKICEIVRYITPHKNSTTGHNTLLKCSKEILDRIKNTLNVTPYTYGQQSRINSREVHRYLTTFFRYTKYPKINPPLTNEVKVWYHQGIDLKRSIIFSLLQSDGCIRQPKHNTYDVCFYGSSKTLHHYFVDAMFYEFNELPTSYCVNDCDGTVYSTRYCQKRVHEIVDEVRSTAGSTKTSPASGQSVDEYLKEPQPTLSYLLNAPLSVKQIAFRLWMSAEGWVGITKRREYSGGQLKKECLCPLLSLSCAHPLLAKQLQEIAEQFSIIFQIKRSKRYWAGISNLLNRSTHAVIEFLKLGGFIKGVRIGRTSPYHAGINKDVLLLGILEFKKRERENKHLKKLPIQQMHYKINKIIENREYKSTNHYINYFSNDDTML